MKKLIVAAKKTRPEDYFGELYDIAVNSGYDMKVSDDLDITFKATTDRKFMPEIIVTKVEDGGKYYYDVEIKFPTLRQEDMEYYDDIESYLKRWQRVGLIAKELAQTSIDPDEFSE